MIGRILTDVTYILAGRRSELRGKQKNQDVLVEVITKYIAAKTNIFLICQFISSLKFPVKRDSAAHFANLQFGLFYLNGKQMPHLKGHHRKVDKMSLLLFLKLYLDYVLSLDLSI